MAQRETPNNIRPLIGVWGPYWEALGIILGKRFQSSGGAPGGHLGVPEVQRSPGEQMCPNHLCFFSIFARGPRFGLGKGGPASRSPHPIDKNIRRPCWSVARWGCGCLPQADKPIKQKLFRQYTRWTDLIKKHQMKSNSS